MPPISMARDGGGALSRLVLVGCVCSLLAPSMPARGADAKAIEEARAYHERATAAFALGRFAKAAELFELAFELTPDPAELFNAAQAHRLANENERALLLYRNYLRVFPHGEKRSEVEMRVEELKQTVVREAKVGAPAPAPAPTASRPPADPLPPPVVPTAEVPVPAPVSATPPPSPGSALKEESVALARPPAESPLPSAPPPRAPAPSSIPSLVTTAPAPADEPAPRGHRWVWWVLGAAVAAAAGVGLVFALSAKKDPHPTLGVFP